MDFVTAVSANLEGVEFFSTGLCCGCSDCQSAYNMTERQMERALDRGEIADEGGFSWSACDSCGSHLGGNRESAHGWITVPVYRKGKPTRRMKQVLCHFEVCVDCLHYHANGDIPESGMVAGTEEDEEQAEA